jgi:hypothetical protein
MNAPIAAYIARDAMEDQKRFASDDHRKKVETAPRPVRRHFAGALRWSADRLSPLPD